MKTNSHQRKLGLQLYETRSWGMRLQRLPSAARFDDRPSAVIFEALLLAEIVTGLTPPGGGASDRANRSAGRSASARLAPEAWKAPGLFPARISARSGPEAGDLPTESTEQSDADRLSPHSISGKGGRS